MKKSQFSAEIDSSLAGGYVGRNHFPRINNAIECSLFDEAQLQRGRLKREIVIHREVGDLRGLVIADHGS